MVDLGGEVVADDAQSVDEGRSAGGRFTLAGVRLMVVVGGDA